MTDFQTITAMFSLYYTEEELKNIIEIYEHPENDEGIKTTIYFILGCDDNDYLAGFDFDVDGKFMGIIS